MLSNMTDSQNSEMTDDIFDEDVDNDVIVSKEWEKVESGLIQGGYREGLTSGKESSLQTGFNEGFTDAAQTLYRLAKQRGNLSGRFSFQESGTADELQKEIAEVRKLECDLINAAKNKTVEQMKSLKHQQS